MSGGRSEVSAAKLRAPSDWGWAADVPTAPAPPVMSQLSASERALSSSRDHVRCCRLRTGRGRSRQRARHPLRPYLRVARVSTTVAPWVADGRESVLSTAEVNSHVSAASIVPTQRPENRLAEQRPPPRGCPCDGERGTTAPRQEAGWGGRTAQRGFRARLPQGLTCPPGQSKPVRERALSKRCPHPDNGVQRG